MTDRPTPNSDQAEFWNGPGGETWTTQRERFNTMLRPIGLEVLKRAQARAGEHVLDVGCGTGETTSYLARLVTPGGSATGLDISDLMLAEARQHNQGHDVPVQFHAADAQTYAFDDDAYIPHQIAGEDMDEEEALVLIAVPGTEAPARPLVINLRDDPWLGQCERVLEVVPADPEAREPLRERWRQYKAAGYDLNKHDM